MSVRFPSTNAETNGTTYPSTLLTLPTAVTQKAANLGYTTCFFFRTPKVNGFVTGDMLLLSKGGGGTGGSDGSIKLNNTIGTLSAVVRSGGSNVYSDTVAVQKDKLYFVMLIVNPTNIHLVACEVGGTPVVETTATAALYNLNMNTNRTWTNIGGGSQNSVGCWYGEIENVAMWTGAFPETGGVPDTALIAALANGTTGYGAVAALMTGGTQKFWFPLATDIDLADAWNGANTLTQTNADEDTGRKLYPSGPLCPGRLMPAFTSAAISQVVFATPADVETATATIRVEGGAYNGLASMSKVQARLIKRDRTVIRDWTDLPTTAPSAGGGTWSASDAFTDVPMMAAYLFVEFRALNSGGTVIAGPVSGFGIRGVGFHILGAAQSQMNQGIVTGSGMSIPNGSRLVTAIQAGNEFVAGDPEIGEPDKPAAPQVTASSIISAGSANNFGVARGVRSLFLEIEARFPGVPVQFSAVAMSGVGLDVFSDYGNPGTPNAAAGRWAGLKAGLGIVQPYFQWFMGHSSGGNSDTYGKLTAVVAWAESHFGTPIKYLHTPVPRYKAAGTDDSAGNASAVQSSRTNARWFCDDNPTMHFWMGSWSVTFTGLTAGSESPSGSNPHPDPASAYGQGRVGALAGLMLMQAARAVVSEPIGPTVVRPIGADAVMEFGRANANAL